MKKKFMAIMMIFIMACSAFTMTGCTNDGADGDLDQTPATDGDDMNDGASDDDMTDKEKDADDNLINDDQHDDSLGDDLKDDAEDIGEDIKDGAEDIGDALGGDETRENNTNN